MDANWLLIALTALGLVAAFIQWARYGADMRGRQ